MKGAAVSQYRDAIDHLPPGAMLVVQDVTWEEYEHLLEELSDRPGVRVTFDQGRLQAVSPLRAHEHYAQVVADMAVIAADSFDLPVEQLGGTTLRQVERLRGVEPDRCFYLANVHRIEGKLTLDLAVDPPPDVVVEIEMSSDSEAKLPIYAGLGVPEIWLYDGRRARILELVEDQGSYLDAVRSKFLPCISVPVLEQQLQLSRTTPQTKLRRAFRVLLAGGQAGSV
jgi:Uma2 family endonuclease